MTFIHYIEANIGDLVSCPKHYFTSWANEPSQPLYSDNSAIPQSEGPIIVGGGGILIPGCEPWYELWLSTGRACVFWGGGVNLDEGDFQAPDALSRFTLVGVRDYGVPFRYVPCASCLSPEFDADFTPDNDYMVYSHHQFPIPIESPVSLSNDASDFHEVIGALLSARTIVTNSYHGAYWGMLLGRRVLLYKPHTNRFRYLRYTPSVCDDDTWKSLVEGPPTAPATYKEECISLNREFANDVAALL